MSISKSCRRESYEAIKAELPRRWEQCLNTLEVLGEATANEIAFEMYLDGITPFFNRNYCQPRLNELVHQGKIAIVDKRLDLFSGRNCSVYTIVI